MSFEFLSLLEDEVKNSTLKTVVGWIGNALALFFFFSPAVRMWQLIKEKIQHTEISYLSFMANIMNCILWFVYGLKLHKSEIWFCNGLGGISNLIYLFIFWFFFSGKNGLKYSGLTGGTIVFLHCIFCLFYYVFESEDVAGKSAMVFNILMYAAPGQKLV